MTLWEILKANKTGIAPDMFTMLAASKMNGGRDRLHELSGTPPLSFTAKGKPLTAWSITGNTVQNGTPTPENPVEVVGVGDRTGNLFDSSTLANDYTLNSTTGLPYAFPKRIATLIPIDVSTLTIVTLSYQSEITNTMFIYAVLNGSTLVSRVASNHSGDTIDVSGGDNLYISFYSQPDNITTDKISNIMLNEGSTPLPYEPYGYKIPVVTRGKNLFDKENASPKAVTNRGVFVKNSSYISSNYISVSPNTTYTKIPIIKSGQFHDLCEYDENKIFIRHIYTANNGTFTTSEKTKYIVFNIAKLNIDIAQLEKGSTATPYEPYHEPITTPIYLDSPLYKIGNYADRLSKTEEVRVVKELVLTGKEDIFYGDAYTRFRVNIADFETFGLRATPFYMSHYIVVSDGRPLPDVPDNAAYSGSSSDNHCIFIKTTNYTTVADFKSYLAAQYAAGTPVKVYYVLATPETKTVEPVEIPTLNGTTVIDVDTAVKPESMTIKYRR